MLRHVVVLGFASTTLLACRNGSVTSDRSRATASAGTASTPLPSVSVSASPHAGRGCELTPRAGIAIPASARATDVRLATSSGKALVTWYETTKTEGPDRLAAYGHSFDGATIGPRITFDTSEMGDEFHSGAAPV